MTQRKGKSNSQKESTENNVKSSIDSEESSKTILSKDSKVQIRISLGTLFTLALAIITLTATFVYHYDKVLSSLERLEKGIEEKNKDLEQYDHIILELQLKQRELETRVKNLEADGN